MLKNNFIYRTRYLLGLFIKNEKGAILLPFIIFLPLFIGLIFLSFEISHFLQKKAKLSDAIEQATLALTVENESNNPVAAKIQRNQELVTAYANAYLPSETFSIPMIEIIPHTTHFEYRAQTTLSYAPKFLTKNLITNINTNLSATDNGVAIKNNFIPPTERTDVVFVADYSSSMEDPFNDDGSKQKIEELREIFKNLNNTILDNVKIKTIGFIPFSWGTKKNIGEGQYIKTYCHFPFIPKTSMPLGQGLDSLPNIDDIYSFPEAIINNIDYDKTIKSISNSGDFINIPINDIKFQVFCLKGSNAYSLESNDITNIDIEYILNKNVYGGTLVSSGILSANDLFNKKISNNKKIMIILSDGEDHDFARNNTTSIVTQTLIDKGMCEKIKENNIRMVFISIGYKSGRINWEECVGRGNYYESYNAHQLEANLQQALTSTEVSEVGRNTPKR